MTSRRWIIVGAQGRMGSLIAQLAEAKGDTIAGRVDEGSQGFEAVGEADGIIDFSHPDACEAVVDYAVSHQLPLVIGTTGHSEAALLRIADASHTIPIFQSANMSIGVALLRKLVRVATPLLDGYDVEIVEAHHNRKVDSPSGTALMLAEAVREHRSEAVLQHGRSGQAKRAPEEIGLHALRMGNVVGDHEVIFASDAEQIRLHHVAQDRSLFAHGALRAAHFVCTLAPGRYDMDDLIEGDMIR